MITPFVGHFVVDNIGQYTIRLLLHPMTMSCLKLPYQPVKWKMRGEECGAQSVENAECGKRGVWKMWSVENEECGKRGVWKTRSVENAECGK